MDSNNKKIITTALAADFIAVLLFIFALQTKISIIIILFYIINLLLLELYCKFSHEFKLEKLLLVISSKISLSY